MKTLTSRQVSRLYNFQIKRDEDRGQVVLTQDKLLQGRLKRRIEMIEEIRDIGRQNTEVWDE